MAQIIRAISFDADNTLWDFALVMRTALGHVLAHMHQRSITGARQLTVDRMIAIREQVFQETAGDNLRLEDIRELTFVRTLQAIGFHDTSLAAELNRVYLDHRFQDIRLYDDVLPVLHALGPHYKLGLLSNGNSYPEKCGLDGRFAEMVHVGDSLETDAGGAVAAGMHAVWLNRDGQPLTGGVRPDAEIRSLSELPAVIESLGQ